MSQSTYLYLSPVLSITCPHGRHLSYHLPPVPSATTCHLSPGPPPVHHQLRVHPDLPGRHGGQGGPPPQSLPPPPPPLTPLTPTPPPRPPPPPPSPPTPPPRPPPLTPPPPSTPQVGLVTLHRPKALNALCAGLMDELIRWPGGQVARWSGGQVARWSGGQVARWNLVSKWVGAGVSGVPGVPGGVLGSHGSGTPQLKFRDNLCSKPSIFSIVTGHTCAPNMLYWTLHLHLAVSPSISIISPPGP